MPVSKDNDQKKLFLNETQDLKVMQRTYESHVIAKYNAPLIDYAKRVVYNCFSIFFFLEMFITLCYVT